MIKGIGAFLRGVQAASAGSIGGDAEFRSIGIDARDDVERHLLQQAAWLMVEHQLPCGKEGGVRARELDGMERDEDVERFKQRLIDRFGPLPQEAEDLLKVVTLRNMGNMI